MAPFDKEEDTGRHATLHDIRELRVELDKHAAEDRGVYKELKGELAAVSKGVTDLAIESAEQNGKLDTLVARTEGKLDVIDERTENLVARTKSKERLQQKTADTQALEVREKRNWKRDLLKILLGGLIGAGAPFIHWLASR